MDPSPTQPREPNETTPAIVLTSLQIYLKEDKRPEISEDVQQLVNWIENLDLENRSDAYEFCHIEDIALFKEVTPDIKSILQNIGKIMPYCFLLPTHILAGTTTIEDKYINKLQELHERYPQTFTDEINPQENPDKMWRHFQWHG